MKKHRSKKRVFENYAYVLDFLPYGYPEENIPIHQRKPVAQGFGEKQFVLMEMIIKKDQSVDLAERVYIGRGKRDKVEYISRTLKYEDLTPTAKTELLYVIMEAVKRNEKRFVDFINKCQPITTRLHTLQLLPGVGKTLMWKILEEREIKPFESFEDIEKRIHRNLLNAIAKRIEKELKEPQRYYLFVKWRERK
ncbi:DUF655 domain-containing protein [Methanofervidicoccus abyssi]|uniref:Nucleotide binding protein n=1 Tax=Methanofervidicoccus abyssi TaxID=2082189 RepID=A0A401HPB8_9EURY|nr:DUF655 domain-containing protein [Methanofervidicoccus abyssi]GBF36079.1 conserved hypothetical protein [Methanofervidicoccus abyssi]